LSATVQIDADPNPGLQGVPLDRGGAPLGFLWHAASALLWSNSKIIYAPHL